MNSWAKYQSLSESKLESDRVARYRQYFSRKDHQGMGMTSNSYLNRYFKKDNRLKVKCLDFDGDVEITIDTRIEAVHGVENLNETVRKTRLHIIYDKLQ